MQIQPLFDRTGSLLPQYSEIPSRPTRYLDPIEKPGVSSVSNAKPKEQKLIESVSSVVSRVDTTLDLLLDQWHLRRSISDALHRIPKEGRSYSTAFNPKLRQHLAQVNVSIRTLLIHIKSSLDELDSSRRDMLRFIELNLELSMELDSIEGCSDRAAEKRQVAQIEQDIVDQLEAYLYQGPKQLESSSTPISAYSSPVYKVHRGDNDADVHSTRV